MSTASGIRIILRHANPLTRAGLCFVLGQSEDFELVSDDHVGGSRAADLLLADYDNGIRAAQSYTIERSPMKVMIISESDRETDIRRALKLGVRAFITAQSSLDEVAAAVRDAHAGRVHLGQQIALRLAESVCNEALTAREAEVLQHVVDGMCNKEIAGRLDVALGTVKSHLRSVYAKLKVRRRTQAIAAAGRRGILPQRGTHPVQ